MTKLCSWVACIESRQRQTYICLLVSTDPFKYLI